MAKQACRAKQQNDTQSKQPVAAVSMPNRQSAGQCQVGPAFTAMGGLLGSPPQVKPAAAANGVLTNALAKVADDDQTDRDQEENHGD